MSTLIDKLAELMKNEAEASIEKSGKNFMRALSPVETFKEEFSALLNLYDAKLNGDSIQFHNGATLNIKEL